MIDRSSTHPMVTFISWSCQQFKTPSPSSSSAKFCTNTGSRSSSNAESTTAAADVGSATSASVAKGASFPCKQKIYRLTETYHMLLEQGCLERPMLLGAADSAPRGMCNMLNCLEICSKRANFVMMVIRDKSINVLNPVLQRRV